MKNLFKKLFNKKQYQIEKLEEELKSQKNGLKYAKTCWFGNEDFSEWENEIAQLEEKINKLKNEKDNLS